MSATAELVVIGGGAAGAAAIRGYREAGGAGRIALVTDEQVLPYERPPLSKEFLRGDRHSGDLPLENDEFYQGVRLHTGEPAHDLDPDARRLTLAGGEAIEYAACVVATGNGPRPLPVPGGDDEGLYHLRSIADARRLRSSATSAADAAIVGSGFIGCEAAASLARRGVAITLVSDEERPQLKRLGRYAADRIVEWLTDEGVTVRSGVEVTSVSPTSVTIRDGAAVRAGLVLVAAGVTPRTDLLRASGLLNEDGTVDVDPGMRTAAAGLFAAGDIARAHHPVAGRRLTVEHWGDAVTMGGIAGANAAGESRVWSDVPGFWSTIGDHTIKYVAWGDGFDDESVQEHSGDGFTVWYRRDGALVGALTYLADDDYDKAAHLIAADGGRSPV